MRTVLGAIIVSENKYRNSTQKISGKTVYI